MSTTSNVTRSAAFQPAHRSNLPRSAVFLAAALGVVIAAGDALAAGDAAAGAAARTAEHPQPGAAPARSCASCHGSDLTETGRHAKTGKPIEPLAPSVNPERLTDPKKVEKWLYRNCRWTLGRECSAAEKADFLAFIASQ